MADVGVGDAIRKWREWSSGSIEELAAIGTAFVWSLGLEPLPETTASSQVTRRTIRYYISNEVMQPPTGERRLAVYGYRHLLQLLYIKARQHAGDRLGDIRQDLANRSDAGLEALVIDSLPQIVPGPVPADPGEFRRPAQLPLVLRRWAYLSGRDGRWQSPVLLQTQPPGTGRFVIPSDSEVSDDEEPAFRHRVEIDLSDGIRLDLPYDHPLVHDEDGRELLLRGFRRLLRNYHRGGGSA